MNVMYEQKEQNYFTAARYEVLDLAPEFSKGVLEIGCGTGQTLSLLKNKGRCLNTVGVELFESAAEEARKVLDCVHNIDIEKERVVGTYELIVAMDVLEHLVDPWSVLKKLVEENLVDGGVLIASIPNVRHYSVIANILKGKFDYATSGILDKTHLRFFTKKSMFALYNSAGLDVVECVSTRFSKFSRSNILNFITLGVFSDFFAIQYVMKCIKK